MTYGKPSALNPSKIKIKPTHYGWGLIFLLVWIPFTALATANNFLLIIFMMLLGIVIVSHSLAKKNMASVSITRSFPEEMFAGMPFTLKYYVKSSRPVWGSLTLKFIENDPVEPVAKSASIGHAPVDRTITALQTVTIATRGLKRIKGGVLESAFPFGMAVYAKMCGAESDFLVYPHIHSVDAEIPPWVGGLGDGREKVSPAGTIPFTFKEYVPGDAYKNIDWKKSAQTGALISRVPAIEESKQITIILPANASEQAISMAASLIVHFEKLRITITFAAPGIELGPGSGKDFSRIVLERLALWDGHTQSELYRSYTNGSMVQIDESGFTKWIE